ncbi:hypothetical protein AB0761_24500 [Peterkaempfera sp. SMS 1(5)a]
MGSLACCIPKVGPLDLRYEKLMLPGAPGQMLVTYHAERGSPSHERLQLLAHLAERPSAEASGGGRRGRPGGAGAGG